MELNDVSEDTDLRKRKRIDDAQNQPILEDFSFSSEGASANEEDNDIPIETAAVEDNDEITVNSGGTAKKQRNKFVWSIDSEWEDLDKALDFLEEQGFVNYDCSDLKCGLKFYFRCKLVPKNRKQWCGRRYTLYLPSNSKQILILRNEFDHDHDKLLEGTDRPPSDEKEEFIIDLFKCGTTKVNDIIRHLDYAREKKGLFGSEENPGKRQIEYMLKKFRNAQAPPMIKLGDMKKWCDQNDDFPSDVDEGFVIGSHFSSFDDDLAFGFAVSTPLLLEMLSNCKKICIDATYKLTWLDFPLVVLGTVDRAKHFHPYVYALVSHEKAIDYEFVLTSAKNAIKTHLSKDFEPEVIIADGADAIRNAFYTSFESAKLDIMCYVHVVRNCRKRPFTSKANKNSILEDIRLMHLAPNRPTFNMMADRFCSKWEVVEPDFVSYFRKEWLGAHSNWFEGIYNLKKVLLYWSNSKLIIIIIITIIIIIRCRHLHTIDKQRVGVSQFYH